MAQDFKAVISSLDSIKPKLEKLAKNSELITVIDDLNDLIDEATGFGGAIAQIVPAALKSQVDALTNIYNQLKSTSRAARDAIENAQDKVESIPVGQLMKKPLKSVADDEDYTGPNSAPTSLGGIAPTQRESRKYSMAFDEDTMEEFEENTALSDFYKTNFKENKKMRAESGFTFDNIREDFEDRATSLGGFANSLRDSVDSHFYAPKNDVSDIYARLEERTSRQNEAIVEDDSMEFNDDFTGPEALEENLDWRQMASNKADEFLECAMRASSVQNGGYMDISDAGDPWGEAGVAKYN